MGAAENLSRVIAGSGLSLRELARRCGLHHSSIDAILKGRNDPTLSTAEKILAAVGEKWAALDGEG